MNTHENSIEKFVLWFVALAILLAVIAVVAGASTSFSISGTSSAGGTDKGQVQDQALSQAIASAKNQCSGWKATVTHLESRVTCGERREPNTVTGVLIIYSCRATVTGTCEMDYAKDGAQ